MRPAKTNWLTLHRLTTWPRIRRIAALRTHQGELKKELDFYQGKNKPPAKLNNDIQNLDFDIQTQQDLLTSKKRDVDTIGALAHGAIIAAGQIWSVG